MQTIPSNWHNCATCAHWCGNAMPDNFCAFVTFDPKETARCAGGGWNLAQKQGMHSCSSWVQRFTR